MKQRALLIHSLLWSLLLIFAASVSATQSPQYEDQADLQGHYEKAKFFYNQLKTSDKLGSDRDNWLKGAGNFRRIYLSEPKSELAPACLFMLGRLYYDAYRKFGQGIDLGESISYYRDVNTLFPGNRLSDDALYAVGAILLEDVNDPGRSADTFARIITDYPDGDMRSLAETQLKQLSKDHDIPLPEEMLNAAPLMELTNVRPAKYWSSSDYTRVVVQTSGPTAYREKLLEKVGNRPRRLYIDFQNAYIEPRYRSPIPIEDGLLRQVRTGQFSPDTVRVVLDIESISDYKIFSLPDPFRVVIDVRGQKKPQQISSVAPLTPLTPPEPPEPPAKPEAQPEIQEQQIAEASTPVEQEVRPAAPVPVTGAQIRQPPRQQEPVPEPQAAPQTQVAERVETDPGPVAILKENRKTAAPIVIGQETIDSNGIPAPQLSLAQQLGLGIGTIVIDPGHGGKDPGALGYGLKEKDIVLKTGRKLAEHLRSKLNATVILTREDDTFLPLEERTAIANTNAADLFISLHLNAHPSPDIRGFETYFLNLTANAEAMRVAARENATSTHQLSDLQDILSDIMKNAKINESSRLAEQVHTSIGSGLAESQYQLKDMGVQQAPFYVLIGAEMPAILIEMAFISNPDDAKLLADDTFIATLTEQIAGGISQYARANIAANI